MKHANSNDSDKPNHLYEVIDSTDDSLFKYGISQKPIGDDGMCGRMREQVDFLNIGVRWRRFWARILLFNIPGRREAKRIEREYIRKYKEEHGERPRGNKTD